MATFINRDISKAGYVVFTVDNHKVVSAYVYHYHKDDPEFVLGWFKFTNEEISYTMSRFEDLTFHTEMATLTQEVLMMMSLEGIPTNYPRLRGYREI